MRAFAITEFGQPGAILEVEKPQVDADQVLVRVHTASVNGFDASSATGSTRSFAETRLPFIPGIDGAGTVDAVGRAVTEFAAGQRVIINAATKPYWGGGTFAELVAVPATAVTKTPPGLDDVEAATISVAGLTALGAVDVLEPSPGQVIVAIGATGGVGSWFTQLAADRGATVVALVRPENADYAKQLGASEAIDYTGGDAVEALSKKFPTGLDGIADFSGNVALIEELSSLLKVGSRIASSATRLDIDAFAARGFTAGQANRVGLDRTAHLLDLISAGRIRAPETTVLRLDQAGDAIDMARAKHTRGKVVIRIS